MSTAEGSPDRAPHRLRWFQFSLSTLLLAITLIAVLVAWQRTRINEWLEAMFRPPARTAQTPAKTAPMVVRILPGNSVWIDDVCVSGTPALDFAARFREAQRAGVAQPHVIIKTDDSANADPSRNLEIMMMLNQAGWQKMTMHDVDVEFTADSIKITRDDRAEILNDEQSAQWK